MFSFYNLRIRKLYLSFVNNLERDFSSFDLQFIGIHCRPVGRNFQRGVRRLASRIAHLAVGGLGPLKAPRNPGVFGAKSCNLAISRHFIQTFQKSCFSKLIFKIFIKFYTNQDFDSHKMSTLIVLISFQGGGGVRSNPWLRVCIIPRKS